MFVKIICFKFFPSFKSVTSDPFLIVTKRCVWAKGGGLFSLPFLRIWPMSMSFFVWKKKMLEKSGKKYRGANLSIHPRISLMLKKLMFFMKDIWFWMERWYHMFKLTGRGTKIRHFNFKCSAAWLKLEGGHTSTQASKQNHLLLNMGYIKR